jgi:hypothetical protein
LNRDSIALDEAMESKAERQLLSNGALTTLGDCGINTSTIIGANIITSMSESIAANMNP